MLKDFRRWSLAELTRVRSAVFDKAVRDGDYAYALNVAAQSLDEDAKRYSLSSNPHVAAADRVALYLASIFGRLDVIDRVIALEELALRESKRPYQPLGYTIHSHNGVEGDAELKVRHEQSNAAAKETHEHRLGQAMEHRQDFERFGAILKAVEASPGIRQVDLVGAVPDRDAKALARMVDQLEATGLVATKKVGSRVGVWPAGHPEGPTPEQLREPRWWWAVDEYWDEPVPAEWQDPARTIADIEALMALTEEAVNSPGAEEGLQPTPLDFLKSRYSSASPSLSRGNPVYYDPDHLAIAFWGHQDLGEASAIAGRLIADGGTDTTPNQKSKWLRSEPRHTHMERMACRDRFRPSESGWVLREVPEPTADSVPVTAYVAAGAVTDPAKAADEGTACWLKMRKAPASKK